VDAFCEGKRKRCRTPPIEIYPKGYTPPYLAYWQKAKSRRELAGKCGGEIQNIAVGGK
jgi:hypothetical protein